MKTFTIGKKKIVLKEEWMVGFITTWIVGLLAHAYRFFNFLPIWDSIYNFTGVGSTYTLGRWFLGYAGLITSMFDLPWVNGAFSLFYISIVVILLTEMFEIKNHLQSLKVLKEVYDKIESKKNVKLVDTDLNFMNRVITTGEQYSYIRIAEGCSNRCTYCAIPYIRGNFVSRKMEDIIEEAKQIVSTGRRELILIAQDTSKYGKDIYGKPKLAELLTELCKIKDLKWVRFLYTYPEDITDELIKVVKENDKICKYFDIPIQHISDTVLKRMNRKCTGQSIKNTISKLRKEIPDVVIRTTLMVGFPGETQEDFDKLYEFVKETKFDKLGAFTYSKEDGTPASRLKEQIHPMTKKSRYNKIMKLQQEISKENERKNIGRELEILIEGITPDKKYYVGRSYMDVPDIDGVAYVKNTSNEDLVGKYIKAEVIDVKDYDLILVEK